VAGDGPCNAPQTEGLHSILGSRAPSMIQGNLRSAGWRRHVKNISLNSGGAIGGLLAAGIAFLLLFDPQAPSQGRFARFLVALVIGSALLGHWLWALLFPVRPAEKTDEPSKAPTRNAFSPAMQLLSGTALACLGLGLWLYFGIRRDRGAS
jgi:hypothetical protein